MPTVLFYLHRLRQVINGQVYPPAGEEPKIELTDDGSATLRHSIFGETYHSMRGAAGESQHVFIANGLATVGKPVVSILEVGFGSGLNAWLSLCYGRQHGIAIDYYALELYPVPVQTARMLNYTDDPLFLSMHLCPWNRRRAITDRFSLTKYNCDLTASGGGWEKHPCDLVYFDAFAPDTQPEMWSEETFRRIYAILAPGGALVTYSAKGTVKQALRSAGFIVARLPGALGKHHMLRAVKPE